MTKSVTSLASAGHLGLSADLCFSVLLGAEKSSTTPNLIVRPLGKTGTSLLIVSTVVMNAEAPSFRYRLGSTDGPTCSAHDVE
jgi:hypothetical protein